MPSTQVGNPKGPDWGNNNPKGPPDGKNPWQTQTKPGGGMRISNFDTRKSEDLVTIRCCPPGTTQPRSLHTRTSNLLQAFSQLY